MAAKTEGECPMAVGILIRKLAKKNKTSITKEIEKYSEESETPIGTVKSWVWPPKRNGLENQPTPKPTKKHTKPETKKQLRDVAEEIVSGKISDDDMKVLDIATAKAITTGKAAARVGTATATAVKKATKKKGDAKPKEIDNFKRLDNSLKSALDGLTAWADGQMKPESINEAEHAKAILAKGTNLIMQFARLGADVQGIYETFIQGGNKHERQEFNQPRIVN